MHRLIVPEDPDPRCRIHKGGTAHVPMLVLNARANIECLTTAAFQVLEYRPGQRMEPLFLSHVHRKDLSRVMRDVVEIVLYGRAGARWLLRLQTGKGGWRWFSAIVQSQLDGPDRDLIVLLKPL